MQEHLRNISRIFILKNNDFYRAFEEKLRGSQELIQKRLEVYLPFILPLKEISNDVKALDIGCGRGEWIGLLAKYGIACKGIDLDKGMLEACKQQKFDVEHGDGIAYLETLESESLVIISAFHVVEHISFEELQGLVEESLRVLKPGGLLIMETPNPENIKVATENFYLDPTHIKPIPAALLSFLPEYYGFKRTKVLRLQEAKGIIQKENISLLDVLDGVSPDYAIVAQKNASQDTLDLFDGAYNLGIGASLVELSSKFEARFISLEEKATQAEAKATQAEAKATQAEANFAAIVNSSSWKITKPIRWLGRQYLKLRRLTIWIIDKIGLYHVVRPIFFSLTGKKHLLEPSSNDVSVTSEHVDKLVEEMKAGLTPSAKDIYKDLKAEVAQQQGKGED